ncbi:MULTISPECIES: NAD(P)-dependent oxidoreductase [Bradyrhizobium]|uniref:NAD(P)-dependent oxidoreductase n=1 Tax=Bradyrhizobium elkanii TaxID=29448 RepID=A0A4U6S4G0_BRAEL|nr:MULTISPECIES: NAD(P)-dependent oxidoreductase [Bradyrhizobium]MTV15193.1 NAD(P)-dependent oxidoreductase [Bradyrhizobium sp. BR2003]TKV80992.1 NAD(P)-dependent oxidoreductase [Bradyrhizobium elkanii]
MRILLTGATGFVGSTLGPRLVAAGHELFCVCRPESPVAFGDKVIWDGRAKIDFPKLFGKVDVVIHLAQSRNYRHFPADAGDMFAVNVAMTMFLLEWAAKSKVKQFCLVSSGAVYEPFVGSLKEDKSLAPAGFLGASKLASEIIARPFASVFALNILRLFFPYGPGQHGRLIPELIRRVRDGTAVHLTDNGEGVRLTPTLVDDVVEVILASVTHGWTETLNVATPEMLTIRQIANMIGRQLGVEPKFELVKTPSASIVPDLGRLASRFQLDRFTRFEDGLRKTISTDLPRSTT